LRWRGFLPPIRDRKRGQPLGLLLPPVPLLADIVKHRFEIGQSCFGQDSACIGFGENRFVPGYGSFPRIVSRSGVICQGRINSMQLAGFDGPLPKLIPPCTDPPRLDASQDRCFGHTDGFRSLPQGVTHVLRSVP
jgi:hypothetical protein